MRKVSGCSRDGIRTKMVLTDVGPVGLNAPRGWRGSFEPTDSAPSPGDEGYGRPLRDRCDQRPSRGLAHHWWVSHHGDVAYAEALAYGPASRWRVKQPDEHGRRHSPSRKRERRATACLTSEHIPK